MKLKIIITGPKVHDIGYRYLLLGGAMGLRIPGFDANNLMDGKNQVVDIVVEGKDNQIKMFKEFVETNKPSNAKVSDINTSDYDGDVMRISDYSQVLTAMQMLKAIPTLLEVRDNTRSLIEGQCDLRNDQRELLNGQRDIIDGQSTLIEGQADVVDEIRELREDLARRDSSERLIRIEKDVRAIKSKIGLR